VTDEQPINETEADVLRRKLQEKEQQGTNKQYVVYLSVEMSSRELLTFNQTLKGLKADIRRKSEMTSNLEQQMSETIHQLQNQRKLNAKILEEKNKLVADSQLTQEENNELRQYFYA
jgi:hypothetical protein